MEIAATNYRHSYKSRSQCVVRGLHGRSYEIAHGSGDLTCETYEKGEVQVVNAEEPLHAVGEYVDRLEALVNGVKVAVDGLTLGTPCGKDWQCDGTTICSSGDGGAGVCESALSRYTFDQGAGFKFYQIGKLSPSDYSDRQNFLEALAAECDSNQYCTAFQTDGSIKTYVTQDNTGSYETDYFSAGADEGIYWKP